MKQMIASRSMVMVHGLMVADSSVVRELMRLWGAQHTVSFQTCAIAGLAADPAVNAAFVQAPGPHAPEPRAPPISLQLCATQSGAGARFADDF